MTISDPSGGIRRRVALAEAIELTTSMRSSPEPCWVQVRHKLQEAGHSPLESGLGALIRDDVNQEYGVVLTRSEARYVLEFEASRPDWDTSGSRTRTLTVWREPTEEDQRLYARWFSAAQWVLDSRLD